MPSSKTELPLHVVAQRYLDAVETATIARRTVLPGRMSENSRKGRGRHAMAIEPATSWGRVRHGAPAIAAVALALVAAGPGIVMAGLSVPIAAFALAPAALRLGRLRDKRLLLVDAVSGDASRASQAQKGLKSMRLSNTRALQGLTIGVAQAAVAIAVATAGLATPLAIAAYGAAILVTTGAAVKTAIDSVSAGRDATQTLRALRRHSADKVNLSSREIRDRAPQREAVLQGLESRVRMYETELLGRINPDVADSVKRGILPLEKVATSLAESAPQLPVQRHHTVDRTMA